jgi:hypothetical protein
MRKECPEGKTSISGGFNTTVPLGDHDKVTAAASYVSILANGWTVRLRNDSDTTYNANLQVICTSLVGDRKRWDVNVSSPRFHGGF